MNKLLILSLALLLSLPSCGQSGQNPVNEEINSDMQTGKVNFSEQSTWLLGYFERPRMTYYPHSEWFVAGYNEYVPDSSVVKKLTETDAENLTIKVVMGTWCPDSRREVPRFLKIFDQLNLPLNKITFIGVDNEKRSPVQEYNGLNIERVPTFIFYINNIEAGRIIEVPKASLEQDMSDILIRNENR